MMQDPSSIQSAHPMNLAADIEKARFNMVEQQIRTWEVLDQQVLDLLFQVKREDFVPAPYRGLAFADMEIPLGHGQAMMAPKVEARIVQELAVRKSERVLEIGTGSGYLAALLASRALEVVSVEIFPEFSAAAQEKLRLARIPNVVLRVGDGAHAQAAVVGAGGFDVIVLTGSTPVLPDAFLDALNPNGRLFAVVGDAPAMKAVLMTKTPTGTIVSTEVFETQLAPLINAEQPARFEF
jgi:protein-L-isoaspartate(D-aspartate) O-methyltransferase